MAKHVKVNFLNCPWTQQCKVSARYKFSKVSKLPATGDQWLQNAFPSVWYIKLKKQEFFLANNSLHRQGSLNLYMYIMDRFQTNTFSYTTQYAKKEKKKTEEQSKDLHDDIRGGLPIHFLTPPDGA